MKKLLKSAGLAILALVVFSCEEDKVIYDVDGGQTAFLFNTESSNLGVSAEGTSSVTVQVGVTTRSDQDRTIPVYIDASSTATADQYSLTASSLVIPAGQFVGNVVITGNFEMIPDNVTETIVLKFDDTVATIEGKDEHVVNLFRSCPTDLGGKEYSVTTTYGFHDFLPDFAEYTMTIVLTQEEGDNTYKIADFSGGLYSVGPYADAYGTGAANAAAVRDLIFTINCNNVSWQGEADPWGPIVPTDGGENSYDPTTGVITISWTAEGYGENGVSVYTPIN